MSNIAAGAAVAVATVALMLNSALHKIEEGLFTFDPFNCRFM